MYVGEAKVPRHAAVARVELFIWRKVVAAKGVSLTDSYTKSC